MSKLAENLRALRETKKIEMKAIAEYLEIRPTTYSNYEKGITEPSIDSLVKLADYHNISLDELLGRDFTSNGKVIERLLFKEEMKEEVKLLVAEVTKGMKEEIIEKIKWEFALSRK